MLKRERAVQEVKTSEHERSAADLRRLAEELYAARPAPEAPPSVDATALLHELGVREIELELRCEELQRRCREMDATRARDVAAARWRQNFDTFFNTIDDLLFVLDQDGTIVHVNQTVCGRLGYAEEELVGRSVLDVHPADRREEAGRIVAAMLAGDAAFCPVPVVTRDGEQIPVETRVVAGVWDGEPALFGVTKDVSALKRSEEQFARAFQSAPALMAISGAADGRFIEVNDTFLTTLGLTRDEVIGRTPEDLGLFVDQRQRRDAARSAEQGRVRDLEVDVRARDGRIVHGLFSADQIVLGDQPCLLTTMLDLTERKRVEAALQESEALYRSILSASPETITVTDLEGRIRMTSASACGLFGYDHEDEALGRPLFDYIAPGDLARAQADIARLYAGGAPPSSEYRGVRADGAIFSMEVSGEVIRDADQRPAGLVFISRDVTARRQAEEELRETTALLSGLLTSIPDIVFFKDRQGVYLGCNPEFARVVGRAAADVVGATDQDLFGPELAAFFREQDAAMMATGQPRHNEEWIEYPDGAHVLIDTLKAPLRDAEGDIIGLLGVSRDITARKEAEERLRESEEQLVRAVEGSGAGLWDWNIQTGETTFDSRWAEIAGYTLDELAPLSIDTWRSLCHPDDLHRSDDLVQRHLAGESPMYECELRVRHKDGHWAWVADRGKVSERDAGGRPVRMTGTHLDVTERHQAEEMLRQRESYLSAIIENQPGLVWLKDAESRFLAVNRAFVASCGKRGAEEVVGKTDLDIWPRELAEAYRADDARVMEAGRPVVVEEPIADKGETRWFETFKAPVLDEEGALLGTTGFAADITERRMAAERLRRVNRQLEQAVAHANDLAVDAQAATTAKSRFLAHMSHEIRTPLNAIIGFAQLLQQDPDLTPQQADRVTIINRSGEHLLALLSDVLQLSKVEARVQRLDRGCFDLHELLEDLALVFGVRAGAKGLAFDKTGLDAVPRFVTGDQLKLRQTLTNLLANAVKFTESGGVGLHASASQEDGSGGSRLVVLVEDTGPGIAADEMAVLFAPFEQTASGRASGSGTGLGLAISRQFAQVMGGELSATSAVGEGSVFRLEVPLDAGTAEMAARSEARRVVRLEDGQPPCSVLIVDDDEDSRTLFGDMLGRVGFDVYAAAGGMEAGEVFSSVHPAVVLMDLWMPGVDGNEATRLIRESEDGWAAKVIALTANVSEAVRERALAAGADAFMTKPFRAPALFEQIRVLTGVRYVYADAPPPAVEVEEAPALPHDRLLALPEALKQQLRDAAVRARHDRLLELAAEVDAVDPQTGAALRKVIASFDYGAVLRALGETAS
jgi:PAS domain S-box-containing protein